MFANRDLLRHGLRNTLWIATVSMVLATVRRAVPRADADVAARRRCAGSPTIYINVIRGIPLLVLIIWVYFGLPLFLGIDPERFTNFRAGVISLTVFHTAFMAEVFRTGSDRRAARPARGRALARHQPAARRSSRSSCRRPYASPSPSAGNDFVGMVKDTSLVGVIGIFELYRTGQKLVSDTFLPFEVWTGISVLYIAIVFCIDIVVRLIERRLRPGSRARGLLAGAATPRSTTVVAARQTAPCPALCPTYPNQPNNAGRRHVRNHEQAAHRRSDRTRRRPSPWRAGPAPRLPVAADAAPSQPGDVGDRSAGSVLDEISRTAASCASA